MATLPGTHSLSLETWDDRRESPEYHSAPPRLLTVTYHHSHALLSACLAIHLEFLSLSYHFLMALVLLAMPVLLLTQAYLPSLHYNSSYVEPALVASTHTLQM